MGCLNQYKRTSSTIVWVSLSGFYSESNRVSLINLGEDTKVMAETRFLVPTARESRLLYIYPIAVDAIILPT